MQEDFLHYVWQYQKFNNFFLQTICSRAVEILAVGFLNTNSGPDFLNSRLVIDNQEWFGAVEIHLKASDWYKHGHHKNKSYDIVILHVVWENDIDVYDRYYNKLPTLELKNIVIENLQTNYKKILSSKKRINCEDQILFVDDFSLSFWKDKLLLDRLKKKTINFHKRLVNLNNDWEALTYQILLENFGLTINSSQFNLLSKNMPYSLFKKECNNQFNLEAMLYGQTNLLNKKIEDEYYISLQKEYLYLKQKYKLNHSLVQLKFFRLRPVSFPTIRLSQFSVLYYQQKNVFSKLIEAKNITEIYNIFNVCTSEYWNNHYVFGKISVVNKKHLSKSFVNSIIVNTIIPLKYAYFRGVGFDILEELLDFYDTINYEKNTITKEFKEIGLKVRSAKDSQFLIELYNGYCSQNRCLHCEIGNKLFFNC